MSHRCNDCTPANAGLSRRGFLGSSLGAGLGMFLSGGLLGGVGPFGRRAFGQEAPKLLPATADRCILLWMEGGPSQLDTFDPKPGRETGGPFQAIQGSVPGMTFAEHLPMVAAQAKKLAVIRSMTSKEGDHRRARYFVHTGYPPMTTAEHPSLGAIVAHHRSNPDFALPSFISVAGASVGAGYFGAEDAPFIVPQVSEKGATIANLKAPTDDAHLDRRLQLLADLEQEFAGARASDPVAAHEAMYKKAVRMMRSPLIEAFDLSHEPAELKAAYGLKAEDPAEAARRQGNAANLRRAGRRGNFGMGCLLARRLVERGVPIVEVTLGGWDTHDDNFERVPELCRELDPGFATLLTDLESRGLLERTLVVWMGEFGRTPKINPQRKGRDHFPKAWSAVLAGGGVKGGQVIGKTDADGQEVADRPVTVPDLMRTFCRAFAIDADKVNHSGPRPIKLVEGGTAVKELI